MSILAVYLVGYVVALPILGRLMAAWLHSKGLPTMWEDAVTAAIGAVIWPVTVPAAALMLVPWRRLARWWWLTTAADVATRVILGREAL